MHGDGVPGVAHRVADVPGIETAEVQELLEALAGCSKRRLRLPDRLTVRREHDTRRGGSENAEARDRRRLPFRPAVRPLCRGEGPHLPPGVDEIPGEGESLPVDLHEIGDGADRVTGRRQRVNVELAEAHGAVLGDHPADRHRLDQREPVLAKVVVVHRATGGPVLGDAGDQALLERRHPDANAGIDRAAQPAELVPVVVRYENVGDPLHLELREVVENVAVAEVDEDCFGPRSENVDVACVAEARHARDDAHGSLPDGHRSSLGRGDRCGNDCSPADDDL